MRSISDPGSGGGAVLCRLLDSQGESWARCWWPALLTTCLPACPNTNQPTLLAGHSLRSVSFPPFSISPTYLCKTPHLSSTLESLQEIQGVQWWGGGGCSAVVEVSVRCRGSSARASNTTSGFRHSNLSTVNCVEKQKQNSANCWNALSFLFNWKRWARWEA